MKENKKNTKKIIVIVSVLAVALIACALFVAFPYRADNRVNDYLSEGFVPEAGQGLAVEEVVEFGAGTSERDELQSVTVTVNEDGLIVAQPEEAIAGLIFYPGARVEYDSYIPLMYRMAQKGITCALVKMPLNFAFLDINAADEVREQFPEIENWYVGGHSLGGAMAAYYVKKHADEYDGLLLLGAYTTVDLSDTDLKVYLAYGTQDGVLNRGQFAKGRKKVPKGSCELVIVGGCHAYFGDYGRQAGDGHPYISREEQMDYTVNGFVDYILQELPEGED